MLPTILRVEWAGLAIRLGSYPFMVFCGALVGLSILLRRARTAHLSPRQLLPVLTGAVCIGFLGARFAFFLQYGGIPFKGGFVLYGGLIGGLVSGLVLARATGLPALRVADLATPCILLATAFGRVGCLLAGCCYGVVCESGLVYPRGSHAFHDQVRQGLLSPNAAASLPSMPILPMESLMLVLLFLITSNLWRRSPRPGRVLASAGVLYPTWRFVAEFFRADNAIDWGHALTFSQGISLACLLVSVLFLWKSDRRTPSTACARFDYRPASVAQCLLLLVTVGLSLGGMSCSSKPTYNPASGERARRGSSGPLRPPRDPGVKPTAQAGHDNSANDCFSGFAGACVDACADAVCDEGPACDGGSDCGGGCDGGGAGGSGGENGGENKQPVPAVRSILGTLRPGKTYKGTFAFEALVNDRLKVELGFKGSLSVRRARKDEDLPLHLSLESIDLKVGEERWKGAGELDVQVSPAGAVTVIESSLPKDLIEALASLDGISGNFVDPPLYPVPETELRKKVQRELATAVPRASFALLTTFEGYWNWVVGEATVIEDPPGTYYLKWVIRK